jgi:prevent-host-death family protein
MATEVGTYEAKTRLPELIRQVQQGSRFTITNRGEPVAQLVPVEPATSNDAGAAIDAFLAFKAGNPVKSQFDIQALIEDGRA